MQTSRNSEGWKAAIIVIAVAVVLFVVGWFFANRDAFVPAPATKEEPPADIIKMDSKQMKKIVDEAEERAKKAGERG